MTDHEKVQRVSAQLEGERARADTWEATAAHSNATICRLQAYIAGLERVLKKVSANARRLDAELGLVTSALDTVRELKARRDA